MKTAVLNSFLKFYVMGSTEIDLFGIAHVKVEDKPVLKIYAISILGRFVWSTYFVQCVSIDSNIVYLWNIIWNINLIEL